MNRRAFVTASLLAIATPRIVRATPPIERSAVAIRHFDTVDPDDDQPSEAVTRVERLAPDAPPMPATTDALIELGHFDHLKAMIGEYYIVDTASVPKPDALDLAARFATFTSVAGIAAFEAHHTLGMIENERFRWTIQATGGSTATRNDLVTGLALLANRNIDGTPEDDRRHAGGLWSLLPSVADFRFAVRINEESATR